MVYKLREDSDFHKRVDKLMKYMEDLGLCVETIRDNVIITDMNSSAKFNEVQLVDNESGESVTILPPSFEYKLIVDTENM